MTDAEKAVCSALDRAVKLRDDAYVLHSNIKLAYVETQLAQNELVHVKEQRDAAHAFIREVASYECRCNEFQLKGEAPCCLNCAAAQFLREWED